MNRSALRKSYPGQSCALLHACITLVDPQRLPPFARVHRHDLAAGERVAALERRDQFDLGPCRTRRVFTLESASKRTL